MVIVSTVISWRLSLVAVFHLKKKQKKNGLLFSFLEQILAKSQFFNFFFLSEFSSILPEIDNKSTISQNIY